MTCVAFDGMLPSQWHVLLFVICCHQNGVCYFSFYVATKWRVLLFYYVATKMTCVTFLAMLPL
jgi:hypothetical protein